MPIRSFSAVFFCSVVFAGSVGLSAAASPITVPNGTKVDTLQYANSSQTAVKLNPAEQVAFLFVYGIMQVEGKCADKQSGPGRPCSLAELVKGVSAKDGQTLGLSEDPAQDAHYRYSLMVIGEDCIIQALPRRPGLGSFAWVGTVGGFMPEGHWYYNAEGGDMAQARKLGSVGYEGKGFVR
jgi:hypothetical protein